MKWTNDLRQKWFDLWQVKRRAHRHGITDHFVEKAWTEIIPNKHAIFDAKSIPIEYWPEITVALNSLAEAKPKRKHHMNEAGTYFGNHSRQHHANDWKPVRNPVRKLFGRLLPL
jgi:hypothetical protein